MAPALLTGAVTMGLASFLWGIFETGIVRRIMNRPIWADAGQYGSIGQQYVATSWDWLLVLVLLRLGLEVLVASRGTGGSGYLIVATVFLLFHHVLLVFWMFTLPEVVGQLVSITGDLPITNVYASQIDAAHEGGTKWAPTLLALGADVVYLAGPIQRDVFGGFR
jgi:hypothetical protein